MQAGASAWIERYLAHLRTERRLSPHTEAELSPRSRRAHGLLRHRAPRQLEPARQFPHPHVCGTRASRRPRAAQRAAPAVRTARLLQLPDPRARDRRQSGDRHPRAQGAAAPAEDTGRRPGREPARTQDRPIRCRSATWRCSSCCIPRACGSRNLPVSTSWISISPTARCACSARARRRASCRSAGRRS